MKISTSLFSLAFAFLILICKGQEKTNIEDSIVSEIKAYVSKVDSDESLAEGITEGIIENDGQSGGFEIYNLFDKESKELFRIRYNEAIDTISNISFYYKDNKLVYVKVEKGLWKNDEYTDLFEQEVYFSNEVVIKQLGQGQKATRLLEIGKEHLRVHNEYYEIEK
jgi:hypothetical protein